MAGNPLLLPCLLLRPIPSALIVSHHHPAPPPPPPRPPGLHITQILANPDWSARCSQTLQRLWGAQLVGPPERWPRFRHFPRLHTLELNCDSQSLMVEGHSQHFESRVLAPLVHLTRLRCVRWGPWGVQVLWAVLDGGREGGQVPAGWLGRRCAAGLPLKGILPVLSCRAAAAAAAAAAAPCRCSLQQFGSAELSRLPLSLETLHLDVYIAVPLLLPAALRLQELVVSAYHILVDWQQLCGQASAHRLGRA